MAQTVEDPIKSPVVYSNSEDQHVETFILFANDAITTTVEGVRTVVDDPFLCLDVERTKKISPEDLMMFFAKGILISFHGDLYKPTFFFRDKSGLPVSYVNVIGPGVTMTFTSDGYVKPDN